MLLRVVLVAQAGEDLTNPPGRDLLASSEHTFADLARAIDRAFARWDISPWHILRLRLRFRRRLGPPLQRATRCSQSARGVGSDTEGRSHQCSGGGRFPISTAASLPMLMIRRSNERCGLPGTYQARARDFRGDPAYAYTAVRHSG